MPPFRQTVRVPVSGPTSEALGSVAVIETTGALVGIGVWPAAIRTKPAKREQIKAALMDLFFIIQLIQVIGPPNFAKETRTYLIEFRPDPYHTAVPFATNFLGFLVHPNH